MKILLTNDDGPFAAGLCPLRHALQALGEVTIVCPAEERSGVGHAITYLVPVRAGMVRLHDGSVAHTLTGMPADCVKFAVLSLMDARPDLVVSGPNLGLNLGMDVFYSGTVAAALEGGFYGVPAVALSTTRENDGCMEAVAEQSVRVLRMLLDSGTRPGAVLTLIYRRSRRPSRRYASRARAPPCCPRSTAATTAPAAAFTTSWTWPTTRPAPPRRTPTRQPSGPAPSPSRRCAAT